MKGYERKESKGKPKKEKMAAKGKLGGAYAEKSGGDTGVVAARKRNNKMEGY
jgi:hypothetical protein